MITQGRPESLTRPSPVFFSVATNRIDRRHRADLVTCDAISTTHGVDLKSRMADHVADSATRSQLRLPARADLSGWHAAAAFVVAAVVVVVGPVDSWTPRLAWVRFAPPARATGWPAMTSEGVQDAALPWAGALQARHAYATQHSLRGLAAERARFCWSPLPRPAPGSSGARNSLGTCG